MLDPAKRTLFEAHFQIGLYLKETFIPKAFLIFMNYNKLKLDRNISLTSNGSLPEDKPGKPTPTKVSPRKNPIPRPCSKTKIVQESPVIANGDACKVKEVQEDQKSAIVEVLPPPAADTIVGKYRLVKSENFDEFMKKLGVGLVKRKLANSVSPMNIIIVHDDGRIILLLFFYCLK